jgi:hypothetical protein
MVRSQSEQPPDIFISRRCASFPASGIRPGPALPLVLLATPSTKVIVVGDRISIHSSLTKTTKSSVNRILRHSRYRAITQNSLSASLLMKKLLELISID